MEWNSRTRVTTIDYKRKDLVLFVWRKSKQ